jgi:hypothetical protein
VPTERLDALRSHIGFPFVPSSSCVGRHGETTRNCANARLPQGALSLHSPRMGNRDSSRPRRHLAFAPLAQHCCDRTFGSALETVLPIGKVDSMTPRPCASVRKNQRAKRRGTIR